MADISTIRHDEIFNVREHNPRISIIGAGATGSRVFAALVELGLTNITVYDFDVVEPHNLANQLFLHRHIGELKVDGLKQWYHDKTGTPAPESMRFINARLPHDDHPLQGLVFLLTDSMASRKEIFDACIKNNPDVFHVIETRMASTHGNVFNFNPINPMATDWWLSTLTDDESTEVSACGASISVGTTASIIANYAVWQMIHYLANPDALDKQLDIYLKPCILHTA